VPFASEAIRDQVADVIAQRLIACPVLRKRDIAVERVRFFTWKAGDPAIASIEVLVAYGNEHIALWREFLFQPTRLQDDLVDLATAGLIALEGYGLKSNPHANWSYYAPVLPGSFYAMERVDLVAYLDRWGVLTGTGDAIPLEKLRADARRLYLTGGEGLRDRDGRAIAHRPAGA
jgi:hypothetical protein